MLRYIALMILLFNVTTSFGQSLEEKAYKEVITSGPSTAPELLVVKIKNEKTGEVKEICTDISSLFYAMITEAKIAGDDAIKKELLKHTKDRTFTFKSKGALERFNLSHYKLTNVATIAKTIKRNHLRDSLSKLTRLRANLLERFYEYSDVRDSLLQTIADSITLIRPITEEEKKMIKNLEDQFYDTYYNDSQYDQYRVISSVGKDLLRTWNSIIKPYKIVYDGLSKEIDRIDYKFFVSYRKKYGISFCHVAFKHGIVSYIGDENPEIEFSLVVQ